MSNSTKSNAVNSAHAAALQAGGKPRILAFAIWLGATTAILLLDHLAAPYLDLGGQLIDERGFGRIIFLLFAASLAVHAISTSRHPLSHFGLAIENGWPRSFLIAMVLGASVPIIVCINALVSGAYTLDLACSPYRYIGVFFTALFTGIFAAYFQEIVYRGYIGTTFRDWFAAPGIIAAALVYALTFHFDFSLWLEPENVIPTIFAMFLIGLTLQLSRIFHGNLVFPIGLSSGWLFVGIFLNETDLIHANGPNQGGVSIFAPGPDLRNSVLLWSILAGAILVYLFLIARKSAEGSKPAKSSFRQTHTKGLAPAIVKLTATLNPISNLCVLAPIDVWIRVLWQSRLRIHPVYWPRLGAIVFTSALTTILNLPERILLPWILKNRTIRDPVVILGVHRSGTTFLHELLALDPQFVVPKGYQVFNPTGFLFLGRISKMLIGALLPWQRPVDSVEFSLDTPNEDEFGIALSTPCSPYWSFTFPREASHFDRFIFPDRMTEKERIAWQSALSIFLKKIMLFKTGRPLLKSPYHTARIDLITELYPNARFIHIHRHPFAVYRSSVHFQENFIPLFQLQFPETGNAFGDRVLNENYLRVENRFHNEAEKLPQGQVAEIKYENLTAETIKEIERVYREIGLQFTQDYKQILENYFALRTQYQRNKYDPMNEEQKRLVYQKLKPLFKRWKYSAE